MSSVGTVVVAQCQPGVICFQMWSAGVVVGKQCQLDVICLDSGGVTVPTRPAGALEGLPPLEGRTTGGPAKAGGEASWGLGRVDPCGRKDNQRASHR